MEPMTDLYAPASVSHWLPQKDMTLTSNRLSAAEANPEGADSIASSWRNKSLRNNNDALIVSQKS